MNTGGAPVFTATDTEIFVGNSGDTNLYLNQTTNTASIEAGNTTVFSLTDTSQLVFLEILKF